MSQTLNAEPNKTFIPLYNVRNYLAIMEVLLCKFLENTAVRDKINNSRVDLGESVKQIDHTDNITL